MLLRPKRGQSCADRIALMFSSPEFSKVPKDRLRKVAYIEGDLLEPQLGLSPEDQEQLVTTGVSVVFHMAADVRFSEPLESALKTNLFPILALIKICDKIPKFQALIFVSTAYSFFPREQVGETVYPIPVDLRGITDVESLHMEHLDKMRRDGGWPNTYTFSKALAENAILQNNRSLKMAIFRPSIVTCAWKEPMSGWINNLFGTMSVLKGSMLGHLRCGRFDGSKIADMVPVDMCVNSVIAVARETSGRGKRGESKVYNCVSGARNPITWGEYWSHCGRQIVRFPSSRAQWYYFFVTTKFWSLYLIAWFFIELLPACVSCVLHCFSVKRRRNLRLVFSSLRYTSLVMPFCVKEYAYQDQNTRHLLQTLSPQDKELFNFDVLQVNWSEYLKACVKGTRLHLLREDEDTLHSARRRYRKLYVLHCVVMGGVICLGYRALLESWIRFV